MFIQYQANLRKAKLNYIEEDESSGVLGKGAESLKADYTGLKKANFKEKEPTGNCDRIYYAHLIEANLIEANLSGADLRGADLSEADLRKTKNLTPKQVYAAKNWRQAKYDADFQVLLQK
ncbi:pentapeptide repeat-containing protein [Pelatocladus sp. BLCC-F211]|uniref:pentapeptide repeat-containing protein n=1 Tax=Pelatocladus sp. BLCC-F211 TaxID=3342752 RepID=UPI0035B79DD2